MHAQNQSQNDNINKNDLLGWYTATFVVDPDAKYAVMLPPTARNKYTKGKGSLQQQTLRKAFDDIHDRKVTIDGKRDRYPWSVAVTPQHRDGWATMAAIDVDGGGKDAIHQALKGLREMGLWAFAQLGKSQDHSGGHIYIPSSAKLPAPLLREVAEEIIRRFAIKGEAYPCNRDLRLPLMMHLHAPGPQGPRRYPLMLQDGQTINATNPWAALAELRARWQTNNPEAMTAIIPIQKATEATKARRRQPVHKSKVRSGSVKSVINWYNARFDLADRLGVERGMNKCPWHDDKHPSLGVWQHYDGRTVCRCLSQHSNCPAASDDLYWDAFNVYCHEHNLTPGEAVKAISQEYGLGNRRRFKVETKGQREPCADALPAHAKLVDKRRDELQKLLDLAGNARGKVYVVKGTPGLGKTYAGARLANRHHNQGKTVSIVAPSHDNAVQEWAPAIHDAYVWQPRAKLCTCHDPSYLQTVANLGYTVPKCTDADCPYLQQFEHRKGKVTIYQHNHVHINHGALLDGSDVIIADESLVGALLEERRVTPQVIVQTLNDLRKGDPHNPAIVLLDALVDVGLDAQKERLVIPGDDIAQRLAEKIGGKAVLARLIVEIKDNNVGNPRPLPPHGIDHRNLRPAFLGRMLAALEHDLCEPDHNPLMRWTQSDGAWYWSWYKRHDFLPALQGQLTSPAVIILDGSAQDILYQKLLSPWEVHQVDLKLPLSPMVRIIQTTKTASTRKIVHDDDLRDRTLRQLAQHCNELDLVLDGGITYKGITNDCKAMFGGDWLHYGGQRGSNALAGAKAIALIASPTAPPDAIIAKAQALYHDEPKLDLQVQKQGVGYYTYLDPRLEAVNRTHGIEELHQAIQRSRPVLSHTPSTILVCSPWPLSEIGITPHVTVNEIPHGNSTEAQQAPQVYRDRAKITSSQGHRADWGGGTVAVSAQKEQISIRESSRDLNAGWTSPSKQQLASVEPSTLIKGELKSDDFGQNGPQQKPSRPQSGDRCRPAIPPPNQPPRPQDDVISSSEVRPRESEAPIFELSGLGMRAYIMLWPSITVMGDTWSGEEAWRRRLNRYANNAEQMRALEEALVRLEDDGLEAMGC